MQAEAVNKWLFNTDTVDKALEVLMTRGHRVAGGDRLGKTIIFAKNQRHADFIAQRFDANYPEYKGSFAKVIRRRRSTSPGAQRADAAHGGFDPAAGAFGHFQAHERKDAGIA